MNIEIGSWLEITLIPAHKCRCALIWRRGGGMLFLQWRSTSRPDGDLKSLDLDRPN